jgi:hypothetical protein
MRVLRYVPILVAALGLSAAFASGGTTPPAQDDAGIAKRLRHEVLMYPKYGMWDGVSIEVRDGAGTLSGNVTQPYKKRDIERIARAVPGVTLVDDRVDVAPLSTQDDILRLQVANAIYRDPSFSRYAALGHAPVHILVSGGRVTLFGEVNTQLEKTVAAMRASGAGLSFGPIDNRIQVAQ